MMCSDANLPPLHPSSLFSLCAIVAEVDEGKVKKLVHDTVIFFSKLYERCKFLEALFYQAWCCPLSPDPRHLLLSQGYVWITELMVLSPEVCRLQIHPVLRAWPSPGSCGSQGTCVCHSRTRVTAEPESEISIAMGSSNTVPFPVVWGLVLLAMYCTTYQNP